MQSFSKVFLLSRHERLAHETTTGTLFKAIFVSHLRCGLLYMLMQFSMLLHKVLMRHSLTKYDLIHVYDSKLIVDVEAQFS